MTDLITTVNRTLTAKEFQGLADHERAAQATEPSVGRHVCLLSVRFRTIGLQTPISNFLNLDL